MPIILSDQDLRIFENLVLRHESAAEYVRLTALLVWARTIGGNCPAPKSIDNPCAALPTERNGRIRIHDPGVCCLRFDAVTLRGFSPELIPRVGLSPPLPDALARIVRQPTAREPNRTGGLEDGDKHDRTPYFIGGSLPAVWFGTTSLLRKTVSSRRRPIR